MELHGDRVVLRPVAPGDLDALTTMFEAPGMDEWWPGQDRARLARELVDHDDDLVVWTVVVDGEVAGTIQSYEERDPEYRHAGIDIALHPDFHGHGIGSDAVRTLARHLIEDDDHHRLVIDPAAANARAIRCYEKVGFRPVGVLRRYERGRDGTFHDGLLMDLLADELT